MKTELQAEILAWQEAGDRLAKESQKFASLSSWSDSHTGRQLVDYMFVNYTAFIKDLLLPVSEVGRDLIYRRLLRDTTLEPATIALLVTKAIVNKLTIGLEGGGILGGRSTGVNKTTLCLAIADAVHEEWKYSVVFVRGSEKRANLFKRLVKDFEKEAYPPSWRRRVLENAFRREELNWFGWSKGQRAAIGRVLLDGFIETPFKAGDHVFPMVKSRPIEGRGTIIELTGALVAVAATMMERNIHDFLIHPPMLTKPKPWSTSNLFSGAYGCRHQEYKKDVFGEQVLDEDGSPVLVWKNFIRRYPAVKRQDRDVPTADYMNRDWSKVLPSVNALQETAYIINRKVYDVMKWAFTTGKNIDGIPQGMPQSLPEFFGDWNTATEEQKAEHKRTRFKIRKENVQTKTKRIMFAGALATAHRYVDAEAIYFPHDMDHRGRAYCKPSYLSVQGPSYVKSLLLFKEGRAITDGTGRRWLAIHGANSYGKDKLSLDDRVKFIESIEDMIVDVATDPLRDQRWTKADNPFEFLAFAFEWAQFLKEGYGFVSHLPVAVDATCSGLQHYGAMLRCPETARAVNLTNEGKRRDIYQDVADVTNRLLAQEEDPALQPLAKAFLKFGIDRKVTKRPTMTLPYSATFKSCMDYVHDAIKERVMKGELAPWVDMKEWQDADPEKGGKEGLEMKYSAYLAKKVWAAIGEVVIRAREAMDWLATAARTYSNYQNSVHKDAVLYDKALRWITPDGFEVNHSEPVQKEKRVKTTLLGETKVVGKQLKQTEIWFVEDTDDLDPADMSSAVAPNFVHSLDATLLRMTIAKAMSFGMSSFMMIHDSFAVHAQDMQTFVDRCIKAAFIEMYTDHDVLADLRASFPEDLELPPVPSKGSLDLTQVQQSEFFFS